VRILLLLYLILYFTNAVGALERGNLWTIAEAKLYPDFFDKKNLGLSLFSQKDSSSGISRISLARYQVNCRIGGPALACSSEARVGFVNQAVEQRNISSQTSSLPINFPQQDKAISSQSPSQPSLNIFGRKVIGIKYKQTHYLGTTETEIEPREPTSEIDIEQELQVKIKGGVGKKIFADIDYDDTLPHSEQQKISLRYLGDNNKFIEEAALGDIKSGWRGSEFLTYSQSLFGARVKAKLGKLNLTGIGSITRGIPESKTFTGRTTLEKREIFDTSYLERKYYRVYFDSTHLPLSLDSVEIYIDDQKGMNNENSIQMTVTGEGGDSYNGYFDKQYAGEDYFLDCQQGVMNFCHLIEKNYVIALSYIDKDGIRHPQTGYRMIKKGQEELYIDKYELKNYYYLGSRKIQPENFLLRILDLNDNEVTSNYEFTLDFELGILRFTSPLPPFPQAYPPLSQHLYTIHLEYSHTVDAYVLHPDIIPASERVYLDGRELTRNVDYQIDYSSGFLNFLDPVQISEFTQIRVDYEWMPFAGGKVRILGARAEFASQERFSLGSTFISQEAPRLKEAPLLDSTPSSQQGVGVDAHYNLSLNSGSKTGLGKVPLNLSFSAELAQSTYNPNTFGRAIIENFESTKISDELPMGKDSWRLSSKPDGEELGKRDEIDISEEDIPGSEINPNWDSQKKKVLVLNYHFTHLENWESSFKNWDSIVYSLSSQGKDYSQRNFLELWVKGEGKGELLALDLGVVSEDVDGDTLLDTEDKNGDGKLNPGEDTGINLGGRLVGEANGRLDTEDLNGNGFLDTDENYATYDWNVEPDLKIDWTGWKKITLFLKDTPNWDEIKYIVKHLRLWIKGNDISGTLKFALISISGDRWQKYNIEARPINSEDDPGYNPFDDKAFRDYYETMYGSTQSSEGKWKKEGALYLTLPSGEEGWVKQTFNKSYDYSDYETLNFWLRGDKKEEDFCLRLGSEVKEGGNYYQKEVKINWQGWKMISIPLKEMVEGGNPSWRNIKQLRASIKNESSYQVEVYLNDIFLSQVKESDGLARGLSLRGKLGEPFSFIARYKEMDNKFEGPEKVFSPPGTKLTSLKVNLSTLKFLPLSYHWSKKEFPVNSSSSSNLEPEENKEKARQESKEYKLSFLSSSWPQATLKVENKLTDYPSEKKEEREDTCRISFEYKNPYSFFLLPTFIQTIYQRGEKEEQFQGGTENKKKRSERWQIRFPLQPVKNFTLKPIYNEKRINGIEKNGKEIPELREKSFSLESRISFFNLSPYLAWRGGSRENNFSSDNPDKRDIFTHSRTSLTLPFQAGALFPEASFWKSLKLYARYESSREAYYENSNALLDLYSQLGLKGFALEKRRTKLIREKENFSLKQRWQPFSFLGFACDYSQQRKREIREGIPYTVEIKIWPSLDFSLNLNKMGGQIGRFFSSLFTNSYLLGSYIEKEIIKEDISFQKIHQPSLIWKGGFKKPQDLALTFSYRSKQEKESYFGQEMISRDFSSHYELKADYFTLFSRGNRLPILRHLVNFKNKVHLTLGLNLEEKRGFTTSRTEEDRQKWKFFGQIGYKVQDNIQMKLGLEGGYLQDRVRLGENNYSYGASCRVEIRF